MQKTSLTGLLRRIGSAKIASVILVALTFAVPALTASPMLLSLTNQILIAITATFSVYIMLQMNLLTFAVPTFMAIGGYAVAFAALRWGVTDVILLTVLAFALPAVTAMALGTFILRLKGVYFVLVTFVLTEITQLILFETPAISGGSNGLTGLPPVTWFGSPLADNSAVLQTTAGLALIATVITALVTRMFGSHFDAIKENEILAQSLGLIAWHYKALGFTVAAGVSGLAGFALVNLLMMAHPTSFAPLSSVNYIAYAIIGGKATMLGPVVGSAVLVWAMELFAIRGEYSQGLFGMLIIFSVLIAGDGIAGTMALAWRKIHRLVQPDAAPRTALKIREAAYDKQG